MDIRTRGAAPSFEEQERDVRRDFWTTLKRLAGQVPFVEDLVAAYYCALDSATPMRVRGILLAALAYFIVRWRYRPLTWLWRFPGLGFTDDAAVLPSALAAAARWTGVMCEERPKRAVRRYAGPEHALRSGQSQIV
jgi:uncharacterized membrane protein YkvA (DUF1232 family)